MTSACWHRKTRDVMGQVHVERTIAASPERIFNWLVDPANFTSRFSSAISFKSGYVGVLPQRAQ